MRGVDSLSPRANPSVLRAHRPFSLSRTLCAPRRDEIIVHTQGNATRPLARIAFGPASHFEGYGDRETRSGGFFNSKVVSWKRLRVDIEWKKRLSIILFNECRLNMSNSSPISVNSRWLLRIYQPFGNTDARGSRKAGARSSFNRRRRHHPEPLEFPRVRDQTPSATFFGRSTTSALCALSTLSSLARTKNRNREREFHGATGKSGGAESCSIGALPPLRNEKTLAPRDCRCSRALAARGKVFLRPGRASVNWPKKSPSARSFIQLPSSPAPLLPLQPRLRVDSRVEAKSRFAGSDV